MSSKARFPGILLLTGLTILLFTPFSPATNLPQDPGGARRPERGQDRGDRPLPVVGKITAIKDSAIDLEKLDGSSVTVKTTDKTQFRKDRQPAKRTDFKIGDLVAVRGEENADHTFTADAIAGRDANAHAGRGGEGGRGQGGAGFGRAPGGVLGKDYVIGEVKSIDPPKLTVLRTDNASQTLELNEDTSLHKGRDSVTMADIHIGDHVIARGALENNVFVPKNVMVVEPEQWNRLQERMKDWGVAPPNSNPSSPNPSDKPAITPPL
jgi:hypothetical protein